jgi:hypothetical protein
MRAKNFFIEEFNYDADYLTLHREDSIVQWSSKDLYGLMEGFSNKVLEDAANELYDNYRDLIDRSEKAHSEYLTNKLKNQAYGFKRAAKTLQLLKFKELTDN